MANATGSVFVILDSTDEDEVAILPHYFTTEADAKDHVEGQFDDHTLPDGVEWDGVDLLNDEGYLLYSIQEVKPG